MSRPGRRFHYDRDIFVIVTFCAAPRVVRVDELKEALGLEFVAGITEG
jgi:hypothetical protein